MSDVRIPDNLYQQAASAAQAEHVSVEEFVAQTLQLRLHGEVLWLTAEQMVRVRAAQEDIKAGRVLTPEQSKNNLEAHRKAWLAAKPS
jgi:hypothetical protein